MKVRKKYTVAIFRYGSFAVLTRPRNSWVGHIERKTTCGVEIWDCTFREAVNNLRILADAGLYIAKRRDPWWWPFGDFFR